MKDPPVFNWLPCKVCKRYHRGERVRPGPPGANWLIDAIIACPDTPGRHAPFYRAHDWVQATIEQIERFPPLR